MSQDIQLASNGGGYAGYTGAGVPAPVAVDPFAANMGGGPGGPQGGTTPLQKIHRTLRGRYGLAIGLAVAGAAMGALAGWLSQTPGYRSMGMIEISPIIPTGNGPIDPTMPMFNQYVQKQVAILQSQRVLEMAAGREDWKRHHPGQSVADALKEMDEKLDVRAPNNGTLIMVNYTDSDREVAQGAVKAIVESYKKIYATGDALLLSDKISRHKDAARALELRRDAAKAAVADLATRYGMEDMLAANLSAKQSQLIQLDASLSQTELALGAAEEAIKRGSQQGPLQVTDALIDSIATTDAQMRGLLDRRSAIDLQVGGLRFNYGEKHPLVQRAVADGVAVDKEIRSYAGKVISRNTGIKYNADGTAAPVTPAQLAALREDFERQKKVRTTLADEVGQMNKVRQEMIARQGEIDQAQQALDDRNRQIESLALTQSLTTGQMLVHSDGEIAKLSVDKRKQFAFLGFVGGAGLPVGLLMLFGLLDSRYRYSDEANTDLSGLTLLGILPNLPDRLSDPEQASIAAHCVHQIRTMMQINTQGADQQAFAITSAASGDGKTSLTLALGLSYAACGTRVLLIDCDLVGAGLTARMNVNATEGVLEAIANRSLLEYVRTTDIADVALLPVGSGGAHHASTLSPQALRRMIADAKKHFDVILVDTGPIMGSIEASLVCAAADGVVLTVARGQQR
ncbi:MAG TPA: AAA family ATPase, partial [Tepidisphaeraceae bacterium]|nr:AAA family ATPase [Tepidisphaeraceae bacterium]